MTLALAGRFLWDFWTVEAPDGQGPMTWLYALSAPEDPDPETRHGSARVEAFRSRDLRGWEHMGVALEPGAAGAWDDLAIWTGSACADPAGGWVMLYTGRGRADGGRAQRIGLARSDDLMRWRKHPEPVLQADPALYRLRGRRGSTNWRDPWVMADGRGGWSALITAQHPDGDVMTSGTVALATSPDLLRWQVHPPLVRQRLCEHMEVPQALAEGGLLVNTYSHHVPPAGPLPQACLSLLLRRAEGGLFVMERVVEQWPSDERYVVKEVRPGVGLCWLGRQADGRFLGAVSDPFALWLEAAPGAAGSAGRRRGPPRTRRPARARPSGAAARNTTPRR